jgi:hypothetical protein
VIISPSLPSTGTILNNGTWASPTILPRPKGFPIEGKKHMKELKNKLDMGFNKINHKYESEKRLSSHHQSFNTIHVRIQTSYIPGG